MLKTLLFVGLLTCVVTLAVLVDYQSAPREPSDQAPERAASARIFAPGRVEGTTREIALRSRIAGRVAEVLAAEGETVRAGEPLARLDDASARHARELATAEVNLAKAELDRLTHGARDEEREEAAALYRAA
jgi:multidrug efflux pump subunit AcrA (membrane-fusion protein)